MFREENSPPVPSATTDRTPRRLDTALGSARTLGTALGDFFASCTGVHLDSLREASSERPFYVALGAFSFAFSCVSALMLMVAVAYVSGEESIWGQWWIGLVGLAVFVALERLILQVPPAKPAFLALVAVPRLVISVLLAMTVGTFASLKLYAPEINAQLAEERTVALAKIEPNANRLFGLRIEAGKNEIARLVANEEKVRARIVRQDLRAEEARDRDGRCGTRCEYFRTLSANDRLKLAAMERRNRGRFEGRRAQMADLRQASRDYASAQRLKVENQDGIVARAAALDTIKAKRDGVATTIFILKALLVALDLTAFMAKLVRVLVVGANDAYHVGHEGRRAQDALAGRRRSEDARTEGERLRDEGRARRRRNRWEADAGAFACPDDGAPGATGDPHPAGSPIEAYSLSELTASSETWERRPVEVPAAVRHGGYIGVGVLVASLLAVLLLDLGGLLLALPAVLAAGILLAQTKGFRTAPAWAMRAIFITFVGGISFPLVLLATNV